MDLRAVYAVPAFSPVYTRNEIPWNFRIRRIHEKWASSVKNGLRRVMNLSTHPVD